MSSIIEDKKQSPTSLHQIEQYSQLNIQSAPEKKLAYKILITFSIILTFLIAAWGIINYLQKKKFQQKITEMQNLQSQFFHFPFNSYGLNYNQAHQQSIYHYINITLQKPQQIIYFKTKYELFLPNCPQISRQLIKKWNQQRQIIQWAKRNVIIGNSIIYDFGNETNYLQLLILSILVGPTGKLILISQVQSICWKRIISFYNIANNILVVDPKEVQDFQPSIIITKQKDFLQIISQFKVFQKQITQIFFGQISNLNKKLLKNLFKKQDLQISVVSLKLQNSFNPIIKEKVQLKQQIEQHSTQIRYIQIKNKTYDQSIHSPIIAEISQQYDEYTKKIPSYKQKEQNQYFLKNFPIKSASINYQRKQKLQQWENQKQIILWVRNRVKNNSKIFYDYNYNDINLFVILNIASLIKQTKITVNCSENSQQLLRKQSQLFKITNIQYVKLGKIFEQSEYDLIITGNLNIMKGFEQDSNKFMLAFIDENNKDAIQTLYHLYTKFEIRKVGIFPSYYYGYTIFNHFMYHGENPHGFFQMRQNKYVIFIYWSNGIENIKSRPNRFENLQQIIRINRPEVKVLVPKFNSYFQLPGKPYHPGFYHLSPSHRSDYMRGYLMNYYGGGYLDIKHTQFDWYPFFVQLQQAGPQMWGIGYAQYGPGDVGCYQNQSIEAPCEEMRKNYKELIGNGQYIYKKNTPITNQWLAQLDKLMDKHYQTLKNIPSEFGTDPNFRDVRKIPSYPLRWGEVGGVITHKVQFKHMGHTLKNFPYVVVLDYL